MSFYLAWSFTKLIGVVVFSLVLMYVAFKVFDRKEKIGTGDTLKITESMKMWCYGALLLIILITSVNVGVRQSELGRSSFNSDAPNAPLEKTIVDKVDSDTVKLQFNKSLNK